LILWVRKNLRLALNYFLTSSSPNLQRLGDTGSGWMIDVSSPSAVAYCAGVGKGITFELELAGKTSRPILVFDPSPTGVNTMAAFPDADLENLRFLPIGLAAHTGQLRFSVPSRPAEGSYSVVQDGIDVVSFPCENLATIMRRNGDDHIDILKIDIEGFEYDVVNQLLDQKIPLRQLCVEFHPWLRPGETLRTIRRLYLAGYRIIYHRDGDFTFLLSDSRYRQLLEERDALEQVASLT
jgi:FkbM family methyltransferase